MLCFRRASFTSLVPPLRSSSGCIQIPSPFCNIRNMSTSWEKYDPVQKELMKEMIIQVDETDRVVGPVSKREGHFGEGKLHRAFSVFLFNSKNELLIQKRSSNKITFPLYWANTCCSHPLHTPSEMERDIGVKRAAIRKLGQELGISRDEMKEKDMNFLTRVLYKAPSGKEWSEHEVDHILLYRGDVSLFPNANEVEATKYLKRGELCSFVNDPRHMVSPWFKLIAENLLPKWWDDLDTLFKAGDTEEETIHRFY